MPSTLLASDSTYVGRTGGDALRLSRAQAVAIWLALTVANTAAIYANARRYVTGTDGPVLIDKLEWWWESAPTPATVSLVGGASFAVFAASLVMVSWRRPEPTGDGAGTTQEETG